MLQALKASFPSQAPVSSIQAKMIVRGIRTGREPADLALLQAY
jgi:hypothetical protein